MTAATQAPAYEVILPPHANMDAPEAQEVRRAGLGASELGAALGLDPFCSPYVLWADKTGRMPRPPAGAAIRAGHMLEPVVADWFGQDNAEWVVGASPGTVRRPEAPWLFASPDRSLWSIHQPDADQPGALLECKAPGYQQRDRWPDEEVPEQYLVQAQVQAWACGVPGVWVAALIGGQDFRQRWVPADPELMGELLTLGEEWWTEHVVRDVPPDPDSSDATTDVLRRLFHVEEDAATVPAEEAERLRGDYLAAAADEKDAKQRKDEAANRMRALLGPVAVGLTDDGRSAFTWKPTAAVDEKRLRDENPQLWGRYVERVEVDRFDADRFREEQDPAEVRRWAQRRLYVPKTMKKGK